jgi:hypothetical protein
MKTVQETSRVSGVREMISGKVYRRLVALPMAQVNRPFVEGVATKQRSTVTLEDASTRREF